MLEKNPYYNFYSVGEKIFNNKLAAISYWDANNHSSRIIWNYYHYDNEMNKLNYTIEPSESLQELYLHRAKKLREEYQYLILFYSGGHDSNQILETFFLNNIFVDEVCIWTHSKKINNPDQILSIIPDCFEPELSAIPEVQYYVERYSPHTKITVIENFEEVYQKYWINFNFQSNVMDKFIKSSSPGILNKFTPRTKDLTLLNPNWQTILEKQKTCFIFGKEKVRIGHDKLGFYIRAYDNDVVDHVDIHVPLSIKEQPYYVELFYNHPFHVKIHLKQAYVIVNSVPKIKLVDYLRTGTRRNEDFIASLIYQRKYKRIYSGLKYNDLPYWVEKNKIKSTYIIDSYDANNSFFLKANNQALRNYILYNKILQRIFFKDFKPLTNHQEYSYLINHYRKICINKNIYRIKMNE